MPAPTGQQVPQWNVVTPVGRFITGDVTQKRTTDVDGRPIADPSKHMFQIGLAIRKDNPNLPQFFQQFFGFIQTAYANRPDALQKMQLGLVGSKRGGLSLKIKDGDEPDQKGNRNPHSAGCYVIYMSTTLPIKAANAMNQEIDPKEIYRGCYCDVNITVRPNNEPGDRCGVYINPNFVRFLGHGEQIFGGMTVDQAFGAAPAPTQLPPGASMTPIAPAGGIPGANPTMPSGQQPAAPSMPGYQPTQPQGMPPGNFAPPNMQPQPPIYGQSTNVPPVGNQPPGLNVPPVVGTPYPFNPPQQPGQMPAGFPGGAAQQSGSAPYPTGYPINPNNGQPVQPYGGYMQPPGNSGPQPGPMPTGMPGMPQR